MSRADGHDGGRVASSLGFSRRASGRRRRRRLLASSLGGSNAAEVLLLVQRGYPLCQRVKLGLFGVCHVFDSPL